MLQHEEQIAVKSPALVVARIRDYAQLLKPNLSLMVVFSSVVGYLLAPKARFDWQAVLVLFAGGILVTGSANTINQILEKDSDKLMKRTAGRPLPAGRMGVAEAWTLAFVAGAVGTALVGWYFNALAGALSFASLLLYAFAYTPMKKVHPIAVFIGAIPGALPPLIGWVAHTNALTGDLALGGWVLFLLQFFWQFPHFWAIGWLGFDEYEKAGIRLLPSKSGRSRYTGLQSTIYSLVLFPIAILARELHLTGDWGMFIGMLAAVYLINASIEFFRKNDQASARRTMFASLIYLPVVLLAFLFNKP